MAIWAVCAAFHAQAATPPDAVLPSEPLASLASRVDPNVVLDLALEASNAGAAYRGEFDATVRHTGLWDAMGCYSYASTDGYFKREATATKGAGGEIVCNRQWSGNLLNWAATSGIDGVRLALTGGERAVDELDRTVLRRAELPASFYRSVHFPDKVLKARANLFTPLTTGDALHFNNCGEQIFVGPSATGSCAEPGSDRRHGAYLARVAVCAPEEAVARGDLCLRYPGGHHKPVGVVQRHSEHMRFSVFGALAGGALLAPMKHTGPTKVDATFDKVVNPQAEWDAATGIFKTGPGAAKGVVEAIHRVGRGGAYGRPDALRALYDESLRYLQGAGLGRGVADPVALSCQKNHLVVIGDAPARDDRPDDSVWTRLVGAFEKDEALSSVPAPGIPGLAYRANTQTIRDDYPDVRARTFVIDTGQRGGGLSLAAKYGGFVDTNGDGNPFRAFDGLGRPDVKSNAEWAEGIGADGKPQPRTYFFAGEPEQMATAMRRALARAALPESGGMDNSAISSPGLSKEGTSLYASQSAGQRGAGSLLSFPLAYDAATGAVRRGDLPDWDAGALLTGSPTARPAVPARDPASRRIFTLSSAGAGTPFEWHALDAVSKGHLSATPHAEHSASDALGPERLAYLRGDRRKEESVAGGVFRVRDSVMGRVAHSVPFFADGRRGRVPAVYVGADDGMLHAFSARTGEELFAYVPRALFPLLADYSSPDHVPRSLVDGSATVADVQLADGAWRSMLVSGMGGGATGVLALDVSDAANFSAGHVMWEFSGADDADMGHQTQPPRVLKFRTTAATRTEPARHRWFAVVPSGFNNANPEKRTALFLLSLDKPANAPWVLDVNYHKIVLPVPADTTVVNALGVPGDYAGADGATRFLYAGDTQGNLWKFAFTANAPWRAGNVLPFKAQPLMVAWGEGARRQPITVVPKVGIGPSGGAIVLFGTGKFVSPDDLGRSSRGVQTVYGVYDNGEPIGSRAARMQLQPRRAVLAGGSAPFAITGDTFSYGAFDSKTATRRGWYLDLPESRDKGERVVAEPVLSDGLLFFNTLIPAATACGSDGGRSCAVNALTGLSKGGTCVPSDAGMPGTPQVVQLGDSVYSTTDMLGRRTHTRRLAVIQAGGRGGKSGFSTAQPVEGGTTSQAAGRLNWRQVVDAREARR
ncbi:MULTISPECIES: pilus assembly protein [unclassified Variovorax]|uniref:pilus assembly protein n=1 Tax=unclassified Variovorax TaxID=663243 RepID=UPI003F48ECED